MPSKREIELFQYYAYYAAKCCVFGIDINPSSTANNNGYLVPTKSKYKLAAHYMFIIWMQFLVLFCVYRNVISYKANKSEEPITLILFMLYVFITVGHGSVAIWFTCYALSRKELVQLWNQLLHYSLNGNQDQKEYGSKREKLLWYGHCSIRLGVIGIWIIFPLADYTFAAKQNWPTLILVGFTTMIVLGNWLYHVIAGFLVSFSVLFLINVSDTLTARQKKSHEVEDEVDSDNIIVSSFLKYRTLQLLCKNINGSYCKRVVPSIKYPSSLVCMLCCYLGIRCNILPGINVAFLATGILATGVVCAFVCLTSVVWSTSQNYLTESMVDVSNVKDKVGKSYLRKVMSSMPPLRLSVAGLYYMEREAKLTYIQFLVNGNINILLTFK